MDTNNQMIQKGTISSVEGKADRNGDKTTARVLPCTADGAVTRPLTIPWWLRGKMGHLKPDDEVAYAVFEDGSGIILARMDGEWDGTVPGDVTVTGGDVKTDSVSLNNHTHTGADGETTGPH